MNTKKILGWAMLALIAVVPGILWYFLKPSSTLTGYALLTQSLGQLAALTGVTLFALSFVLSTRMVWIEDLFGGLDKVYVVHAMVGATALVLLLFHPILLVLKYFPGRSETAAQYLLPGSHWSVNFGIIALTLLIALIYVTLYTKIKYNKWKNTHTFLGAVFIIAVLHIFLVRGDASRDSIFTGYYAFAAIVSLIGISSFSYTLLIKKSGLHEAIFTVQKIEKKKQGVYEIGLKPKHKPIRYKSGQFVFLRFYNEALTTEAHPFSIISKSNEPEVKVIIKDLGDFTNKIERLKVEDEVAIEGPYGRFNYNKRFSCDQVWIAGGIGITPFIGMAADFAEMRQTCTIDLYHTVRNKEDLIAFDYLKSLEKETKRKFRIIPWISSESGHIDAKVIAQYSKELKHKEIFICGPKGFKAAFTKGLAEMGVPKTRIHQEEFSFR
ncbi:MAG: ferric reductase-like transmembrane domain-containing protein [Candidatus Woesearchaeota archaeon]